jgi:hypothetical protein
MGSEGMGMRNSNGDKRLDFPSQPTASKVTKGVFNQIDYVLCQKNATAIIEDSRTY